MAYRSPILEYYWDSYYSQFFTATTCGANQARELLSNPTAVFFVLDKIGEHGITELALASSEVTFQLSKNPALIELLKKHPKWINSGGLLRNPNPDVIAFSEVCNIMSGDLHHDYYTPMVLHKVEHAIRSTVDKLSWDWHWHWAYLSKYTKNLELIEGNLDNIHWDSLALNPIAIPILEKNLDKLNRYGWSNLSQNPNAIHILEKNLDKVIWEMLHYNPNAGSILEKNLDKLVLENLIVNINALALIEQKIKNGEKINNLDEAYCLFVQFCIYLQSDSFKDGAYPHIKKYIGMDNVSSSDELYNWVSTFDINMLIDNLDFYKNVTYHLLETPLAIRYMEANVDKLPQTILSILTDNPNIASKTNSSAQADLGQIA